MPQKSKILVVMPALCFGLNGAEQMDRNEGIKQLVRLGYDVKVIAKLNEWQDESHVRQAEIGYGCPVIGIPYRYSNRTLSRSERIGKLLKRLWNPLYLDGAAFEYSEPRIQEAVAKEADAWKPDIMWFEYTYLWPLYHIAKKRKIPIITRSLNFEPEHFIEEEGSSFLNEKKKAIKLRGEQKTIAMSDVLFSITPDEKEIYDSLGARKTFNLPLRGLPKFVPVDHDIRDRKPLNVFFMGSTYTVHHNREALRIVIEEIAPKVFGISPDGFRFHIFGKKLPQEFERHMRNNVQYRGFVEGESYLEDMDIALIPSLFGAGMQQKVFEPLTIGIPLLTSTRGIAGYPFEGTVSVLFGTSIEGFVRELISMRDRDLRVRLSRTAKAVAREIFSQEALDSTVEAGIWAALGR